MLKVLLIIKIFKLFSWLFGYVEKRLDRKVMIDFKLTGNQIIIMHMFPNISRSSGNQTMKFG